MTSARVIIAWWDGPEENICLPLTRKVAKSTQRPCKKQQWTTELAIQFNCSLENLLNFELSNIDRMAEWGSTALQTRWHHVCFCCRSFSSLVIFELSATCSHIHPSIFSKVMIFANAFTTDLLKLSVLLSPSFMLETETFYGFTYNHHVYFHSEPQLL